MKIGFGPVVVVRGQHKGRVGYYDDDSEQGKSVAIVLFSSPSISSKYCLIPPTHLRVINSDVLLRRKEHLTNLLLCNPSGSLSRVDMLEELVLVDGLLSDRLLSAVFNRGSSPRELFISHSSNDRGFALGLAVDLKCRGFDVWFDEWDIQVGDSIPEKIGEGVEGCDFLVVVLSKSAEKSMWVKNEWQTKYWDEITRTKVTVLPIIIEDCTIPTLLKMKRYADFRKDYALAFDELCHAITLHAGTDHDSD